jgi:hypothetical protein
MLSRRPNEEEDETPIDQHGRTVSRWLRAHGHDEIASTVENLTASDSSTPSQTPAPQQPSAPAKSQTVDPMSRVRDHAKRILQDAPLDNDVKARIWDVFYNVNSSSEFAKELQPLDIENSLKHELFLAHRQHRNVEPSRVDKVIAAIRRMTQFAKPARGVSALDASESHPHVLKALADAALKQRDKE